MSGSNVMLSKDAVSAKLAKCFVTIGDRRYLLLQAKDIEAKFKKNKKKVAILGQTGQGNKATGWEGSGKMTIYYNTSIFTDLLIQYKDTGEDTYFDMQIENNDPSSAAGSQTIILKGCNIDGGLLAAFDADGDWLEQDIDFTFEDVNMPEKFKILTGMI